MLNGKKVTLRPPRESDLEHFLKWFNDLTIMNLISFYLPTTEKEEKAWLEGYSAKQGKDILFVIEACEHKNPIGFCSLSKINHRDSNAEITSVICDKDYWNKGFGQEIGQLLLEYAFHCLNLHRIQTGAYGFNKRSIKSLRKLGFRKEGCQKQAVFRMGKYEDVWLFGLLRSEWEKTKRP